MPAKYTETDLVKLYGLAVEEGWGKLEPGEKRAVGRWCRATGRTIPGETTAVSGKSVNTTPESRAAYFKNLGFAEVRAGDDGPIGYVTPETARDMALLKSVKFVEDWPEDIDTRPPHVQGKWERPAQALKLFAGRIAVIATGLSRRSATSLRRRLRSGAVPSFRPKGSYRIEIAPDHKSEGMWTVLAQYVGDATPSAGKDGDAK